MTNSSTSLTIPKVQTYYIQDLHRKLLDTVARWTNKGQTTNVLVQGPQGTGKSELAQQFAAHHNRPFAIIEIGLIAEPSALFGKIDLVNNSTVWTPSLFTTAIQTPGSVIHLQEINRPENDRILNGIFSVLDSRQRGLWNDDLGEWIRVAQGVTFFASLNEGYEFVGTIPMDAALADRFRTKIRLTVLPTLIESQLVQDREGLQPSSSLQLVKTANLLRNNKEVPIHVSTRNVLDAAAFMTEGLSLPEAMSAVLAINDDNKETITAALHFSGQLTSITDSNFSTW